MNSGEPVRLWTTTTHIPGEADLQHLWSDRELAEVFKQRVEDIWPDREVEITRNDGTLS